MQTALQSARQMAYIWRMDTMPPDPASFRLTESAARRVAEIAAAEGGGKALRVAVLAGGCSGFQYSFALDGAQAEDDVVIQQGDARVLIDPASLDLLAGSELDYAEALMGAHFAVRNPNASSGCGCGTSFAIE
jgi:iron-sulfur cluster assembly accessory protein